MLWRWRSARVVAIKTRLATCHRTSSTLREDDMKRGYRDVMKQLHPDYFLGASPVIVKRNEAFITQLNALLTDSIPESICSRVSALCQLPFYRKVAMHQECLIAVKQKDDKHEFFMALFTACELHYFSQAGAEKVSDNLECKPKKVPFSTLLSKNIITTKDSNSSSIVQDWHKEHAFYANTDERLFLQNIASWVLFPKTAAADRVNKNPMSLFSDPQNKLLDVNDIMMHLFLNKSLLVQWRKQHPRSFWLFMRPPDWPFASQDDFAIQDGNYYFKMGSTLPQLPSIE